jgi:two-component system, NtrC family, response regulator AtoC
VSVTILLVDDDRSFGAMAATALRREGFAVTLARSLHEARKEVAREAPGLVVLDRRLPDGDGLSYLEELRAGLPGVPVVIVTANNEIASAVDAIRSGAADYLVKPVELADLAMKARQAVGTVRLRDRLQQAEQELSGRRRLAPWKSESFGRVIAMLDRIAGSPRSPVLFLGETGSGKEVLARYLHARTFGEDAPFVHVNCAALPATTIESELFGYERGAFTDARVARRGLAEVANGGTLFLDEVGELPIDLQPKILTFLDSGRFRKLGGVAEQSSTARVVAATNRDLQKQIAAGAFREDLWFRLSVFRMDVPPLRERPEDVLPLALAMLADLAAELGRRDVRLSARALERLAGYPFPGNVRELRSILERTLVLASGPELDLDVLAGAAGGTPAPAGDAFRVDGPPVDMEELQRRYARYVLEQLGGKRMDAARALGISYPTFLKRIGSEEEAE